MWHEGLARLRDRLQGVHVAAENKFEARCPAHDDQHASLSVGVGDTGKPVLHCHAGCHTLSVLRATGLSWSELCGNGQPPHRLKSSKIANVYSYRDAAGDPLFQVARFEPKNFRQRRPDGHGGWIWNLKDTPRVLYRLPELLAPTDEAWIFVVEGEKDVDRLVSLGRLATCNPGGAGKWSKLADDSALHGRRIAVVPDKDDPGRKHAAEVARRLHGKAAGIRVIELPGDGKDVSDWLDAGGDGDSLLDIVNEASDWTPDAPGAAAEGAQYELGQVDSQSGRLVLSPERTLPTGEAFVREFYTHPDGPCLHAYADCLWAWKAGRYVQLEDGALAGQLLPWLHEARRPVHNRQTDEFELKPFPANPRTCVAAIDSLKALQHVSTTDPVPRWLDTRVERQPVDELLPCLSALVHLPTLKRLPATPALFNLNALDYDHDPRAPEPKQFLAFLNQLLGDDLPAWDLLQEWFGHCLSPDTSQQKILLIVGPKRGGKGTLARVLTRLVGRDNVAAPTVSGLAGTFGMQPLIGKSLAIVSDARFAGEGVPTVVERLLCISGEDSLTIDRKHIASLDARLPTRFVFLSNELPRFSDTSGALASRFVIIRLVKTFYGREDSTLTNRLLGELPGILNWAIKGWHRLRERGHFVQPASVEDAVRDMEDLSSPVGAFVREQCTIDTDARAYVADLYVAWKQWCEQDGRVAVGTKQVFCRNLLTVAPGLGRRRDHQNGRFYDGLRLKHAPLWPGGDT